jgi:two-component system, NarL family, sensor histidine kinase DesK
VTAPADHIAAEIASDATRRATVLAVTVLGLLLAVRLSNVLFYQEPGQLPFTVALFVLPVACAFPGPRRRLVQYPWPALAVQALLTWVPLVLFGMDWQQGIDGLLAGLVLLLVAAPVSWLLAGGLVAADVMVRATVTGLPPAHAWYGVIYVVIYYVDDALVFFGLVRLAQVVREVEGARRQAADLAVARERLHAAKSLQTAVGQRLAGITANAAAARRALSRDVVRARAEVAAAGIAARLAAADARALAADRLDPPESAPGAAPGGRAVIGAQLASAVLVTVLLMFGIITVANVIYVHVSAWVTALSVGDIIVIVAVQLYVSRAVRDGSRPHSWLVIIALQAALVYAFASGSSGLSSVNMAPFLAGSVLLLVPGWARWTVYAVVVASSSVLYAALPLRYLGPPFAPRPLYALFFAAIAAEVGLLVYGLSRLAWRAREQEGLRDQLARVAAVTERLRVARDVHDLLGLGLSAVALKTDLIARLIGRDDARAAAEMEQMSRLCAGAQADIRLVTGEGARLSLAEELAAARQILASAGIEVSADAPSGPLPAAADEVLAPVLREAVTNMLRHSAAAACTVEVTVGDRLLQLRVGNDGVAERPAPGGPSAPGPAGRGLANLTARVQAAGGRLAAGQAGGRFDLTAEIPLSAPAGLSQAPGAVPGPPPGQPAGSR